MKAVIRFACIGCVCAAAAVEPAFAQQPPEPPGGPQQGPAQRPVRPLFGSATGSLSQSLTAGLSFGGAYDVEQAKEEPAMAALFESKGRSAFGNANLSYSASSGRFSAGASVRSAGFYFKRFNTGLRVNSGFTAHGNVRLWGSSGLGASHELTYAPYHLASLTAAELLLQEEANPHFDPSTLVEASINERTDISFSQPLSLTRRLSGAVGYGFHTQRRGELWGHHQHDANATLNIGLTRGLAARVGYQYAVGRSRAGGSPGPWADIHNIDAGLNLGRRLSLWRRLDLSFRTGVAGLSDGHTTRYTITGGARLSYEISRNWMASTGFHRNVQFFDDLQAPGVANSIDAGVRGALTRRLSLHGRFVASSFDAMVGAGDNRVKSISGSVGLSASVSPLVSVGIDYSNGHHSFGRDVVLFPGVPRERSRQAIQARITVSAPLFVMSERRP